MRNKLRLSGTRLGFGLGLRLGLGHGDRHGRLIEAEARSHSKGEYRHFSAGREKRLIQQQRAESLRSLRSECRHSEKRDEVNRRC